MKTYIIAMLLILFTVVGCTDEAATTMTLHKAGFTHIRTTGHKWFACGEHDSYSTGFVATNPQGVVVDGVVCCGFAKSCTVRF